MKPPPIASVVVVPREDERLRAAGFRIHARPKTGPAIWERAGKLYTQAEALREATRR